MAELILVRLLVLVLTLVPMANYVGSEETLREWIEDRGYVMTVEDVNNLFDEALNFKTMDEIKDQHIQSYNKWKDRYFKIKKWLKQDTLTEKEVKVIREIFIE